MSAARPDGKLPRTQCRTHRWRSARLGLLTAGTLAFAASAAAEPANPGLEELVQVTDLSGVSASPDSRQVAFRSDRASVGRNSYDLSWHIVDLATGSVRRIAPGGDPIIVDPGSLAVERPIWSPDGKWIYYRALRSGAVQIWRSATDGSGSSAVTAEDGDVLSMEPAPAGEGIVYRVGPPRDDIERTELDGI